jgi:hypothetical protein
MLEQSQMSECSLSVLNPATGKVVDLIFDVLPRSHLAHAG